MNIVWYGHSCFKIQTKPWRKSEEVTIFTDPFDKAIGIRPPQGSADIVSVSHFHYDHNNIDAIKGDPFVIDSPGEYEIKGVQIEGIDSFHDKVEGKEKGRNTIFVIDSEGIRVCHLGDLGHALNQEQLDRIGSVDVLLIPVGGKYTLDADLAEKVCGQIEPKIIIPMHFKVEGLKIDLDDEKKFLSAMGSKFENNTPKLTLKAKELGEIESKIIVMNINGN